MKEKVRKQYTLKQFFSATFGALLILSFVLLFVLFTIGIIYVVLKDYALLVALEIILPTLVLVIVICLCFTLRTVYRILITNLYEVTKNNYNDIYNEKISLEKYEKNNIVELNKMNEVIDKIKALNSNVQIINKNVDFEDIPLEFYPFDKKVATEKTFKQYIKEIISVCAIFRNAVIRIDYPKDKSIEDYNVDIIVDEINKIFQSRNSLIAMSKDKKTFYAFVPIIDSISLLRSDLDELYKHLTISYKDIGGASLVSPKINCVVYPYTLIEDIFNDLNYSNRKNKEINLYIPEKLVIQKADFKLHSTLNINAVNKIITELIAVSKMANTNEKVIEGVALTFKKIINYLLFDEGGVILYNEDEKKYFTKLAVKLNQETNDIFKEGHGVEDILLNTLTSISDEDCSYYFSGRDRVDREFGKIIDNHGIGSGFFFALNGINNKVIGVIYFANFYPKRIAVDSYIRESLVTISSLTMFLLSSTYMTRKVLELDEREENLLKVSNYASYTINRNTFEITDYSTLAKVVCPDIKIGEPCYKCFFNNSKPCKNCPVLTRNKTIKNINKKKYEVSFSINNSTNCNTELLIKEINDSKEITNRFDPETGINTIYTFYERLKSLYLTNSKGYVVTLSFDNVKEIVEKAGNEGYSMLLRLFANDIAKNILKDEEVYLYKSNILVLLIPEVGKIDVINAIENIYPLSKKDYLDDGTDLQLDIGYVAIKFPQEFAHSEDLVRHIERTVTGRDCEKVLSDMVYLEENGFTRPASRKDYILSIIDKASNENKFIMKLQPYVSCKDKKILGAEVLVRLPDVERDTMLNTPELIRVAYENNKLHLISNRLIEFVGNAYKNYGSALFKNNNFRRISVNADYSYFTKDEFFKKMQDVIKEAKISSEFLVFEITEKELFSHYGEFKPIIKRLRSIGAGIVCDQYTGEYCSIEKISLLGIKEIKTDRYLINDIDINTAKFETIKTIVDSCNEFEVYPTILGIENSQQYDLIKPLSTNIYMQGYYFYHPMSITELVEQIKRFNN